MSNIKTGDILNFDYTGTVQTVTLPKGTYKFCLLYTSDAADEL